MRKAWIMILTAMLLFTACGKQQKAEEVPAVPVAEKDQEAGENRGDAQTGTDRLEPEQDTKPKEEAKGEYQKGVTTKNGWESEYLGLGYRAPEGMHMSTEEELNSMMGIGEEVLSDDFSALQLKYAEMVSVYEMMSINDTGTVNVSITSEKVFGGGMDAEAFADAIRQQLMAVSAVYYVVSEQNEAAIVGGKEFIKLACMADYGGVSMYQDYYIRAFDDRMVSITVTYTDQTKELAGQAVDGFEGL